jgi:hypothetical protein
MCAYKRVRRKQCQHGIMKNYGAKAAVRLLKKERRVRGIEIVDKSFLNIF